MLLTGDKTYDSVADNGVVNLTNAVSLNLTANVSSGLAGQSLANTSKNYTDLGINVVANAATAAVVNVADLTAYSGNVTANAAKSVALNVGSGSDLTGLIQASSATSGSISVGVGSLATGGAILNMGNLSTLSIDTSSQLALANYNLANLGNLNLSGTAGGNAGTVTLGLNNGLVGGFGQSAKDVVVDASKLSGNLTLTAIDGYMGGLGGSTKVTGTLTGVNDINASLYNRNNLTFTGGTQADQFTIAGADANGNGVGLAASTAQTVIVSGGAGQDTLRFADILGGLTYEFTNVASFLQLNSIETLDVQSNTVWLRAKDLAGQVMTVTDGNKGGILALKAGDADVLANVVDLSTITIDPFSALGGVIVDASTANTAKRIVSTLNGNDIIYGGKGDDVIQAFGTGPVTILGGGGVETVTGNGIGNNAYTFASGVSNLTNLVNGDSVTVGSSATLTANLVAGKGSAVTVPANYTAAALGFVNDGSLTLKTTYGLPTNQITVDLMNATGAKGVTIDSTASGALNTTVLTGTNQDDTYNLGLGTNTVTTTGGKGTVNAALGGTNTITVDGTSALTLKASAGTNTVSVTGSGNTVNNSASTVAVSITGGSGADVFTSGQANDTLTGGASADTFNISAGTTSALITDLGGANGGDADTLNVVANAVVRAENIVSYTGAGKIDGTATLITTYTSNFSTSQVDAAAMTGGKGITLDGRASGVGNSTNFIGTQKDDTFNLGLGTNAETTTGGKDTVNAEVSGRNTITVDGTSSLVMKATAGTNTITGGVGNDLLISGSGADALTGGGGQRYIPNQCRIKGDCDRFDCRWHRWK
ncbi:MAG: hypothetical protein QM527_12450 [Alphaproteobacteria bacterium]|nr:hypothetical protein [Alphaproteobacteria bacterium]